MDKPALVLVDMQNDFFDVRLVGVGRIKKAVCLPAIRRLVRFARDRAWPLVHVVTEHDGAETLPSRHRNKGMPVYCLAGSPGAEIVSGLFDPGDTVVKKQGYSGFSQPKLLQVLENVTDVVLAGVAANCCVLATALDAASHGRNVYVPYQAVAASSPEAYEFGVQEILKSAGAIIDLAALLEGKQTFGGLPEVDRSAFSAWWGSVAPKAEEAHEEYVHALRDRGIDDALALLERRLGA